MDKSPDEIFQESNQQLQKTFAAFEDYCWRARAKGFDYECLEIEYYGTLTSLKSLAVITSNGKEVIIQPFDRSSIDAIVRSIVQNNPAASPTATNSTISFPGNTKSSRRSLVRGIRPHADRCRKALYNIKRDAYLRWQQMPDATGTTRRLEMELGRLLEEYLQRIQQLLDVDDDDDSPSTGAGVKVNR